MPLTIWRKRKEKKGGMKGKSPRAEEEVEEGKIKEDLLESVRKESPIQNSRPFKCSFEGSTDLGILLLNFFFLLVLANLRRRTSWEKGVSWATERTAIDPSFPPSFFLFISRERKDLFLFLFICSHVNTGKTL